MLDVHNLQRRWIKYKLRTYAPYIGGSIAVLILSIGSSIWFSSKPVEKATPLPAVKTVPKSQPVQTVQNNLQPSNEATVLEPSMEFVNSLQAGTANDVPTQVQPERITPPQRISGPGVPKSVPAVSNTPEITAPPQTKPAVAASVKPLVPVSAKPSDSKSLAINRNEAKLDISVLEQRFKETGNPNTGLFVSRYHYDHGNYASAYNYALKTNEINPNMEDSWIIFAKSQVKLGQTDMAKKTLQLYTSRSNSDKAKELLNAVEQGTFK